MWISYAFQELILAEENITLIKDKLDKPYRNPAPLFSIVKNWLIDICCSRTSTKFAERSIRPTAVATPKRNEKVLDMVLDHRRLKVRHIADVISHGSVVSI